ncbi:tetratricopeptide repeat protein [Thermodesulfobacteriota bacterium]
MNQQRKSTFVNGISIVFIALAGFGAFISIIQNILFNAFFPVEEMMRALEGGSFESQIPFIVKFVFSNLRIILFGFFVFSGTTLVSAIGLLKRKNWARIIFIAMIFIMICSNIFSLIMMNSMFELGFNSHISEMDASLNAVIYVMKIFSFVFVVGLSYFFGWVIYKLTSLDIKKEFVASSEDITDDTAIGIEFYSAKRRNIALVCSFVLLVAVGVFYFGSIGFEGGLDDAKAGWEAQKRNDWDEAIRLYTKALDSGKLSQRDLSLTYLNRGTVYHRKRQYDQAISDYEKAIESKGLAPEHLSKAYLQRAYAYQNNGQNDLAIYEYNRVIDSEAISPRDLSFAYLSRGTLFEEKNQYDRAINDFDKAIELDPENARPYNSKAWFLSTCPDQKYRDGTKALELALKSVSIQRHSANVDTLAAAYAETGDFETAVKTEQEAISICSDPKLKEELKEVLEAYKQGITYVEFKHGKSI